MRCIQLFYVDNENDILLRSKYYVIKAEYKNVAKDIIEKQIKLLGKAQMHW